MVNYNPKEWFGLIFKFHKSDTFRQLFWVIISIAIYSFALAYVEIEVWKLNFKSTAALHSVLGFVLSILLVFRTNTAYDRWWEGRRLWGTLVNDSRSLALKLGSLPALRAHKLYPEIMGWMILYPRVLAFHLRNLKLQDPAVPMDVHQPNFIEAKILGCLNQLRSEGILNDHQILWFDNEIKTYTDVCGACERIKNTPIPYSYSLFLKKFIFVYIITMPYGFIREFGYGVTLAVSFVFYVLASLELIAEEIENPFGTDANDLELDQIADTIAHNIKEIVAFVPAKQ
jgi:putative membrane protein